MGLAAVWSFVLPLALVAPRLRWFRLSLSLVRVRRLFWSFCVCGASFLLSINSRLALVLVAPRLRWFR